MRQLLLGFVAVLGFGCASDSGPIVVGEPLNGRSCSEGTEACRLTGSEIGREGVTIKLNFGTAKFVDWIPKAGEPGKYTGFSIELAGSSKLNYAVKLGNQIHFSQEASWRHLGSNCPEITTIDLGNLSDIIGCDNPDGCHDGDGGNTGGGGSTDDSGGSSGGGCDNPDGCPDGPDGPIL